MLSPGCMGWQGSSHWVGHPLVETTLEGLRRILAKPKVWKAEMLKAMVEAARSEVRCSGGLCWVHVVLS